MDTASEYNFRACCCFAISDVLAAAQAQRSAACKGAHPSYNALHVLDKKKWMLEDHLVPPI
jgi:hypothetical protein